MSKTITALFDVHADALDARQRLIQAGIPDERISVLKGSDTPSNAKAGYDHEHDEGGFWATLRNFFMPEEDRYSYAEGMNRGATLLSVQVDSAFESAAMDILEERGSINLDEREESWRKEGWGGYPNSAVATGPSTAQPATMQTAGIQPVVQTAGLQNSATRPVTEDTETIPVMKEDIRIGKRSTESGRVRIRSYIVETPVSEQVSLHNETVQVERRPLDRPVMAGDAMFKDRTIEAVAHSERAVVDKDVRVTEEIGIKKQQSDRVETIKDTVRHTEVEVDDGKGNVTRAPDSIPPVRQ